MRERDRRYEVAAVVVIIAGLWAQRFDDPQSFIFPIVFAVTVLWIERVIERSSPTR